MSSMSDMSDAERRERAPEARRALGEDATTIGDAALEYPDTSQPDDEVVSPDMRSPGGEGTPLSTELGAAAGTTSGTGGVGKHTAGGGTGPELDGGTTPDLQRRGNTVTDRR